MKKKTKFFALAFAFPLLAFNAAWACEKCGEYENSPDYKIKSASVKVPLVIHEDAGGLQGLQCSFKRSFPAIFGETIKCDLA